ncbi:S-phase kinase-associated protein 1-like protein [Dinothrombium tinctorium]|uniref:S-phase kinase-associated protein 1-like protein n=1 Tax=Dinothrombium tinctorium TaxID=1965070 RepID=A0A3S3NGZ2_9ACAR|nr:S-phase kinase-associated protein 1-like protein [Dinothrombium tinctorium]RWS02286.1 S-phase kinase-associated protein 1-like protein [Dinothrombium tinctorium]RWS02499.1 S-phase kinase-associated protein 1-like protein [Dinothrombium tinctorium]
MAKVKLESNDHHVFEVDKDAAELSLVVKGAIANTADDDSSVPLPKVCKVDLERVVEWITHHQHDPQEDEDDEESENERKNEPRSTEMDAWDAEFIDKFELREVFDLLNAANYMDVKGLFDVCCKKIAKTIHGKNAEQIRATFGVKCDFTEAELRQIEKENEWLADK